MTQLMPLCTLQRREGRLSQVLLGLLVMVAREVKDAARQATYRYFMYSSFTL